MKPVLSLSRDGAYPTKTAAKNDLINKQARGSSYAVLYYPEWLDPFFRLRYRVSMFRRIVHIPVRGHFQKGTVSFYKTVNGDFSVAELSSADGAQKVFQVLFSLLVLGQATW